VVKGGDEGSYHRKEDFLRSGTRGAACADAPYDSGVIPYSPIDRRLRKNYNHSDSEASAASVGAELGGYGPRDAARAVRLLRARN